MFTMLLFAKYSLVSTAGATKREFLSGSQRELTIPYRREAHSALSKVLKLCISVHTSTGTAFITVVLIDHPVIQ